MLYLVGLGLDLSPTCKALEVLKRSEVYLELYTMPLRRAENVLSSYGISFSYADRDMVESDFLVSRALKRDISLVVLGDPLFATTHYSLIHEARLKGVGYKVFHNASIFDALGETGLSPYKFGRTVTLAKWRENYKPLSPLNFIEKNKESGLHTLVLVDVPNGSFFSHEEFYYQVKDMEKMYGKRLFEDVVVLSYNEVADVYYIPFDMFLNLNIKAPFSLIIPGSLSPIEEEFLSLHRWKK